jgi:hypothetical protein
MEASGPKTEKVTWSDGDENKCQAKLGWVGDQYQRPEIGDQRPEVRMTWS